jgi:hypothetical protein
MEEVIVNKVPVYWQIYWQTHKKRLSRFSKALILLGWKMGLEPTTYRTTKMLTSVMQPIPTNSNRFIKLICSYLKNTFPRCKPVEMVVFGVFTGNFTGNSL